MPITVKNIPVPGLGAYDLRISYDPAVINVTGVLGGAAPFNGSPTGNTGTPGLVLLNAYQATQFPGPTGDIVVAYVVVTAVGTSGSGTALNLTVITLSNVAGGNIAVTPAPGSITIS